jgi:CheY-like chemotaxis protein
MRNSNPILSVEDDNVDVMTVERASNDLKVTNRRVCTGNGEQALEYLKAKSNKKPCVILPDLNMPKTNRIEFLKIAKADDALRSIPVAVLTTSKAAHDIAESFELGAAGYMVKSVDYNRSVGTVKTIDLDWTLSELPNGG